MLIDEIGSDMKDMLLRQILRDHGFVQTTITSNKVSLTIRSVDTHELNIEGAPIPGTNSYYHNYVYPNGLVPGIENIQLTLYPDSHKYKGRVQSVTLPWSIIENPGYPNPSAFIYSTNLLFYTNHTIEHLGDSVRITIDYSPGGLTPATELIDHIISALQPRIADKDDIKNRINYISDIGRLAPLLILHVQQEARKKLLNQPNSFDSLLALCDVDSIDRVIALDIRIFYRYLEKIAREEGLLATKVREFLRMDSKNWIAVDNDFFHSYTRLSSAQAEKFKSSLKNGRALYISTTSSAHAFAIKVDFAKNTLFVANPGSDHSGSDRVIRSTKLREITGCNQLVYVINTVLKRDGDIPFDDVCTADSIVLAQMMMETDSLFDGCMNTAHLKTGLFIRKALYDETQLEPYKPVTDPHNNGQIFDTTDLIDSAEERSLDAPTPSSNKTIRASPTLDSRFALNCFSGLVIVGVGGIMLAISLVYAFPYLAGAGVAILIVGAYGSYKFFSSKSPDKKTNPDEFCNMIPK